jgi:N-acetylglutamate synthase-like GNAT family acetyltransferase
VSIEIVAFLDRYRDGVRDLIVPIQREEFEIPISYDQQPDLHDIPRFYQRGKGGFWVAMDGPTVVGSIGLLDIGHNRAALRKMFVKQAYRGSARGVASWLLKTLIEHATRHGVKEIYLGTTEKFLAAHRFYEKTGFDLSDAAQLPASFPRMAVDTRFYRRCLG